MEYEQEKILQEWFSLTEEELVDIFLSEEVSEEQLFNALLVVEEKYDLTEEELKEFLGAVVKYGAKAANYLKNKASGVKLAADAVKSGVMNNPITKALKWVNNYIPRDSNKIYNLDQYKDYIFGGGNQSLTNKNNKEEEISPSTAKKITSIVTPKKQPTTKPIAEKTMQKSFAQFTQEIFEYKTISFGDLPDEILIDIVNNESADEYHYINALLTLHERELINLSESEIEDLFEAPLSDFGTVGQKLDVSRDRNAKDLQQSKQMSKLSQSSIPAKSTTVNPAKPMLPTAVQSKDMAAKPTATASTSGPKPLTAHGSAGANVEAGRSAYANKAQAMKNVAKMGQSGMSVGQSKTAQAGLDAARNAAGSNAKTTISNALKSAGSFAKNGLSSAGNLAKGNVARGAGRLAVGNPTAALMAGSLAGGYEAGKQLNKISSVNKVTDKVGKWIADKISGNPNDNVNKAGRSLPTKAQSEKPVVMGAKQLARYQQNNPEQKGKVMGVNQQNRVDNPKTSYTANRGSAAKPASPVQKSLPRSAALKPSAPKTNNSLGMSSDAFNDLRASAAKMKSATSDMASKTGAMKTSLQKAAPSGRMERPITKGGMSSSQIHQNIAKLGGEPTRPVAKAIPKIAPKAAVSGGAPTTAIGSKPPPLDRSTAKKM